MDGHIVRNPFLFEAMCDITGMRMSADRRCLTWLLLNRAEGGGSEACEHGGRSDV